METRQQPFYFRFTMVLLMLLLIGFMIFVGKDIVVPFSLSILVAILLMPICNYFQRKGLPKALAVILSLLIAFIFAGGIIYFLSSQIISFFNDFDEIKKGVNHHLHTLQQWIKSSFGLSFREQTSMLNNLKGSGEGAVGTTFATLSNFLFVLSLLPIYTFLMLYYRHLIKQFLVDVFTNTRKEKVSEVLQESRSVIQSYMVGLIIEFLIVTVLNSIGFLILGIKYAIFLAVFAAILNILPYIGMLIASVFCVFITLTTSPNLRDAIWVLVVLTVVQFLDNNIIMPNVVGSKVKLNALMTIVAVLVGGLLCGVAGMFLSIPGIAILKIIFDRIDELNPWGRLLGDDSKGPKNVIHMRKPAKAKT